jgi:photosystem II stability/assembly factor-like uncharacterized protein
MTTTILNANDTELGQVLAFAASMEHCFAATTTGLYRSEDNGRTWQNLYSGLERNLSTTAVAVSLDGKTMIAGVEGGMLYSNTSGTIWKRVPFLPPTPHVTTLATHEHFFIAGTAEDGIFTSENNGLNWLPWNLGLLDERVLSVALSTKFATDQKVFLGTESGLYVSKNRGKSWLELSVTSEPVISLSTSGDTIIAGTENQGAFLSCDGGATWRGLEPGPVTSTNTINAVHVSAGEIWLLLPEGVVRSSDHGNTWSVLGSSGHVGLAFLVIKTDLLVALARGGSSVMHTKFLKVN